MVYREIVHTCSNSNVARAAVASIGGDFARRFAVEASRCDMPPGAFAAKLVKEFAQSADEVELNRLTEAAEREDLPLLGGLRYILERGVARRDVRRARRDASPPAWMIEAARGL